MIRQIAPLFFTLDIPRTIAWYKDKLGFESVGAWQDPPVYAIVARDERAIHCRCAAPSTPNPDKYEDELLDAYVLVEDADHPLRRVRRQRRRIHPRPRQHAVELTRICRQGLRRPPARLRIEPIVLTAKNMYCVPSAAGIPVVVERC